MTARSAVPASSSPAATKHTPGTWTVSKDVLRDESIPIVGDGTKPQSVHVCHVLEGIRVGEREANAALIAAAPDLLAACRCALERISDGVMEQCREDGQPTKAAKWASDDTIAHLRAAIAKAVQS